LYNYFFNLYLAPKTQKNIIKNILPTPL